ncbi:MAG: CHAP domain-containing protein [Pseudomonadota bacterium]|nr:CHAP domain-containing protein [Pseudomonadota bacterium]
MKAGWVGQSLNVVAGTILVLAATQNSASASRSGHAAQVSHHSAALYGGYNRLYSSRAPRSWHPTWQRSALQCVPFARENSGIELSGNAGTWWDNASGLYERGARPEVGSVLNFRATGHMRMGHVAVVTNVISSRHIEIDHANWGAPGRISRNIDVVDVSPANDWTQVRVALSQAEDYGSTYPTFGFIYDRPDHGTMVANNTPLPLSRSNVAPSDVQIASERITLSNNAAAPEEVAEAVDDEDNTAPRYSGHRRSVRASRSFSSHAAASGRRHGYSPFPTASSYRISMRGSSLTVGKPHKATTRRHF